MRQLVAYLAVITTVSAAQANVIVQTLPANEDIADMAPFDIRGMPFNPNLGTLTSVVGVLSGLMLPAFLALGLFQRPPFSRR